MTRIVRAFLTLAIVLYGILQPGCQTSVNRGDLVIHGSLTAKEAWEVVQPMAKSWAPEFVLMSASTTEPLRLQDDMSDVMSGRFAHWQFRICPVGGIQCAVLELDTGRSPTEITQDLFTLRLDIVALDEAFWNVDSDEALSSALTEGLAEWLTEQARDGSDAPTHLYMKVQATREQGSHWSVYGEHLDERIEIRVSADNGALLSSESWTDCPVCGID